MSDKITGLTNDVIKQMAGTPSLRLREIMESAVRHLHAFANEVQLTPEEWIAGISFLTETGQMCNANRQEFILLSDTLGLSSLVNLLHDQDGLSQATESSVLGPFFRENAPSLGHGESIAKPGNEGVAVSYYGQITDTDDTPIADANIQIWQTDSEGRYDIQLHGQEVMDMRGSFTSDSDGWYRARSVLPKSYPLPEDGPVRRMLTVQERHGYRPAHIHFLISAPGYKELVTALYLEGDPYLQSDTVFGVTTSKLIVTPSRDEMDPLSGLSSIRYDFKLAKGTADACRVGADVSKIHIQ
ncbi:MULTISPECIES: dioxygenase [unclassified Pseudomonas]|uniref:dioxygenase family protein n=1 Tax=unclassified Pseudomonas TaxID=196821 RepID=UPI00088E0489|nr:MULTISPECIES: dioxygenase [unclassified Pseudomonas]SCZ05945.1 catechol 1,2-dioxygenase [Pseudomonas sp. NFACC37-1]SFO82434.1 catechol 1,2-dioxygenase [Pseudomonas sp. NFACC24-1]